MHQDYEGSVDKVSNVSGTTSAQTQFSFDAYGKRRNTNWSNDNNDAQFGGSQWIERGYTGPEHLDNVRMIHMNGRIQEPIWGRMLSPDPVIGDLSQPQSLNAYSYVSNNPISETDPSGFVGGPPDQMANRWAWNDCLLEQSDFRRLLGQAS